MGGTVAFIKRKIEALQTLVEEQLKLGHIVEMIAFEFQFGL